MNTTKTMWLKLLFLCATLAGVIPAHAYYDPGAQRWLNRDPLASQSPQVSRLWGKRLLVEINEGINLYWPFANNPISQTDKDGRILPVLIVIGGVAILATGCGSKGPPPPDPYGCWAKGGNGVGAGSFKGPLTPGKGTGCLLQYDGCMLCCEEQFPTNGGDPAKFEDCANKCNSSKNFCISNQGKKK